MLTLERGTNSTAEVNEWLRKLSPLLDCCDDDPTDNAGAVMQHSIHTYARTHARTKSALYTEAAIDQSLHLD